MIRLALFAVAATVAAPTPAAATPGPIFPLHLEVWTCFGQRLDPQALDTQCRTSDPAVLRLNFDGTAEFCDNVEGAYVVVWDRDIAFSWNAPRVRVDWADGSRVYWGDHVGGGLVGGVVLDDPAAVPGDYVGVWSARVTDEQRWLSEGCP